jgi:hypothetical protein
MYNKVNDQKGLRKHNKIKDQHKENTTSLSD